jgi:hypothetical protein
MKTFLTLIASVGMLTVCIAQTVTVQLDLEKGATYSQQSSSDVSVKQNYAGQEIDIQMKVVSKVNFKVLSVTNTGYDMEVVYERISMIMEMPTGTMEFSSDKPESGDVMSSILAAMMNKPFGITMTRQGKVPEVRNISALFESAFEKYPDLTDDQKQQIIAQLSNTFGEQGFKGNIEMVTAVFPEGPVAIGDTWTSQTELESGMTANVKSMYRLESVEDAHFVISGKSEIVTKGTSDDAAPMKYDLAGTMTSTIKLAKKTGWIHDASIKQSLSGKVIFSDSPQMPGGMEVPMEMDSDIAIVDQ